MLPIIYRADNTVTLYTAATAALRRAARAGNTPTAATLAAIADALDTLYRTERQNATGDALAAIIRADAQYRPAELESPRRRAALAAITHNESRAAALRAAQLYADATAAARADAHRSEDLETLAADIEERNATAAAEYRATAAEERKHATPDYTAYNRYIREHSSANDSEQTASEHRAARAALAKTRAEYYSGTDAAAYKYLINLTTRASLDAAQTLAILDALETAAAQYTRREELHAYAVTIRGRRAVYANLSYIATAPLDDESRTPSAVIKAAEEQLAHIRAYYLAVNPESDELDLPSRTVIIRRPDTDTDTLYTAKDITRRTVKAIISRLARLAKDYSEFAEEQQRKNRAGVIDIHRDTDQTHIDGRYTYLQRLYSSLASVRDNGNGLFIDSLYYNGTNTAAAVLYEDARDLINAAALAVYEHRNGNAQEIYTAAAKAVNDIVNANRKHANAYRPRADVERELAAAKLTRDISTLTAAKHITAKQAYALQRRIDGQTVRQIAAELKIDESSVRERQDRASLRLIKAYIAAGERREISIEQMKKAADKLEKRLNK